MSEQNTEKYKSISSTLLFAIIAVIVVFDQITKYIVKSSMRLYDSIDVLGSFFRLTYIENPGMAFGIQMGNKILFTTLSVLAAIVVLVYLIRLKDERLPMRLALASILGGAIGNLIDRLLHGRVVDFFDFEFIDIHIPSFKLLFINFPGYELYRWPIFNIADMAVSTGMILITWMLLFQKHPQKIEGVQPN